MEELPKKKLLRPDECAKFLGVHKSTIYRWADEGHIKRIKMAGTVRIPRAEMEKISCESG
jgi:excisionase family DNA binding protein